MNISSVNKIFFKLGEFQLRWRALILGVIILFTASSFTGLPTLRIAGIGSVPVDEGKFEMEE